MYRDGHAQAWTCKFGQPLMTAMTADITPTSPPAATGVRPWLPVQPHTRAAMLRHACASLLAQTPRKGKHRSTANFFSQAAGVRRVTEPTTINFSATVPVGVGRAVALPAPCPRAVHSAKNLPATGGRRCSVPCREGLDWAGILPATTGASRLGSRAAVAAHILALPPVLPIPP